MSSSDSEDEIVQSIHSWVCHFQRFSSLPHSSGDFTDSPIFTLGGYQLRIRVYPEGYSKLSRLPDTTGYTVILLELNELNNANVSYCLFITIGGSKVFIGKKAPTTARAALADRNFGGHGLKVELDDLKGLIQSDDLVVLCEIYGLDSPESTLKLQRFSNLENFLNDQEFSDVKIIVQGKELCAHKIILSNGSTVFAAMLRHDTQEKMHSIINIEDIDHNVMLELLRFLYAGKVCGLEKLAKKLLVAADKYCVKDLKSLCEVYLSHSISISNVTEFIAFSDWHSASVLRENALSFFKKNKNKIISTPEFGRMVKNMHPYLIAELFRYS